MKIVVMGAGAVGSYFGGLLTKSGEDVILIAKGKHFEAMRKNGLKVKSVDGDFKIKVNVTNNPKEVEEADLILFAVKSYDTEEAIQLCKHMVKNNTVVMSLQNGVDNEEKISNAIGKEKVVPALVRGGFRVISPGFIEHSARGVTIFGEENGNKAKRVENIHQLFKNAGIEPQISDDINYDIWFKFMWNIAFNQITAIARKSPGEVVEFKETNELARFLLQELVEVANKKGIKLGEAEIEKTLKLPPQFLKFKTSMLQDMEAGKKLEADAFSGVIVKYGSELNISTPYNNAVYSLLKLISN